ncbi:hypothetical protein ACK3TF_005845 [Chlorella vulgaris]
MRACQIVLLAISAFGLLGAEPVRAVEGLSNKDIESVMMMFISDLTQSLTPVKRRALLSLGGGEGVSFGDFMSNLFGGSWRDHVPEGWTLPSFDWSDLGEFEYSNNMGEFLMSHDLPELVTVTSPQDLHNTLETIESSFCEAEEFKPAAKVPAACQGPKVSIALVPKVCTLQGATKQVVCDPAKLVLTKTPGSCTHKHLSASKWTGKECKISGTAGLASNKTVGGGIKEIPLTSFFQSDRAATEFAAAPAPAPITA